MRRKEGPGRRRDEEREKMKKLFKKMKNEKVAKGSIIGLAGPCSHFIASYSGSRLYDQCSVWFVFVFILTSCCVVVMQIVICIC